MEVSNVPANGLTEFIKRPLDKSKPQFNDDHCENGNSLEPILKNMNLNQQCLTLKDMIDGLYRIFESDRVNIEEVHALMSAYKSNPAEWVKFAKFDRYRYTRNLVDAGNGKFNLMILCWGEGHASSIHDHADAHCFMKMLAGNLCEMRYKWPEDVENDVLGSAMVELSRSGLATDEVCYINDTIGLHRVENLSYTDCAVSLHLYCPPFSECNIFDLRTGRSTKSQVTFWSVKGERCKKKKSSSKREKQSETESEEHSEN